MSARPLTLTIMGALVAALGAAGCARGGHHESASPSRDTVSVGYGTQERRDVTSAIASVTPSESDNAGAVTLEQLIEGRVSGVEVLRLGGNQISLRIRGSNSVMASTEPLYVVDGMRVRAATFSEAMSGINPHDVARIDILKDAAATAIYGSEGANGVVLVTTRRAK